MRTVRSLAVVAAAVAATVLLASACRTTHPPGASEPAAAKPAEAAADAPVVVSEFIVGVGDELGIEVYRHDDLKKSVSVGIDGKIMYPLVGDVAAAGRSVYSLRDELTRKLARFVVDPQVSIQVTAIKSRKTLVLGEVRSPGYFVLDTELSVLDALSMAGGTSNDANLESVLLVRRQGREQTQVRLDVKSALAGKDLSANVSLRNGDILVVPTKRIASVANYLNYIKDILSPIVTLEAGIVLWPNVKDVFTGDDRGTQTVIPAGQ